MDRIDWGSPFVSEPKIRKILSVMVLTRMAFPRFLLTKQLFL